MKRILEIPEQWLAAVARELAPFSAAAAVRDKNPNPPLLFVILDSPAAVRAASAEIYWRYVAKLREFLVSAGLRTQYFVTAATSHDAAARSRADAGIGIAGSWSQTESSVADEDSPKQNIAHGSMANAAESASHLTQSLKLSQTFPAIISEFDLRSTSQEPPAVSDPSDRFLAWAAFVTQGAGGIIHSDLQNTLSPAGYRISDRGEDVHPYAAIDLSGDALPNSERIRREHTLVDRLGAFFASSHRRSVLGIVDWRTGSAFSDGISAEAQANVERDFDNTLRQIERVSTLANIPAELADPVAQSPAELARNPVLLLVIPSDLRGKQFLSAAAQNSLLEFVRRGGALICNPELPLGNQFQRSSAKCRCASHRGRRLGANYSTGSHHCVGQKFL